MRRTSFGYACACSPDHRERGAHPARGEQVEDLRRPRRVRAVVDGQRHGVLPPRARAPRAPTPRRLFAGRRLGRRGRRLPSPPWPRRPRPRPRPSTLRRDTGSSNVDTAPPRRRRHSIVHGRDRVPVSARWRVADRHPDAPPGSPGRPGDPRACVWQRDRPGTVGEGGDDGGRVRGRTSWRQARRRWPGGASSRHHRAHGPDRRPAAGVHRPRGRGMGPPARRRGPRGRVRCRHGAQRRTAVRRARPAARAAR